MKSIIVLALACLASAGAFADPIQPADTSAFDTEWAVQTGIDFSANGSDAGLLEEWALAPADESVQILASDGSQLTYRRQPRYDKYCRSSQLNAWGFGGRCYERSDDSHSVPEPGTLMLLGTGLLLLAWSRKRQKLVPIRRNA